MNRNRSQTEFLGQGWRFSLGKGDPPGVGVDARGGVSMSSGEQDIEQAIFLILGTAKGERVMRPDFGSNLSDFVFAPNNVSTASLLAYEVEEALGRWEPRIEVTNVEVQPDPNRPACLLIDIQYQVKATNDEVNMVFPFYLNPTEE